MNLDDYEYLVERCRITLTDNNNVVFEPYRNGDRLVSRIIKNNCLEALSMEDFQELGQRYGAQYNIRQKMKKQLADRISDMTIQEIGSLSLKQKLDYLDILFPAEQTKENLVATCEKNYEKIRVCLFNLDFSKDFWNDEMQKVERFSSLIADQPDIINRMKKGKNTTLDDKKDVIQQASRVFEYVYGIMPKIEYFTTAEEKERQKAEGFSKDTHVNAAYYNPSDGKIYFNEERLKDSDVFFAVSVLLHEGTHLRQDNISFGDAQINRMFNNFIGDVNIYEDLLNDKTSANYKDLYTMLPDEKHAYGVQQYMEQFLMEKIGIEKTNYAIGNKEAQKIHDKAFAMVAIAQYKSQQK